MSLLSNLLADAKFLRLPIKSSQTQQEQFQRIVRSRKEYSSTAREVVQFNSVEQFNNFFLKPTQDAQAKFENDHEHGAGLLAKGYQNMSTKALNFVNQFSPILQMVESCGYPYGGLAIGTISVLFTVSFHMVDVRSVD